MSYKSPGISWRRWFEAIWGHECIGIGRMCSSYPKTVPIVK